MRIPPHYLVHLYQEISQRLMDDRILTRLVLHLQTFIPDQAFKRLMDGHILKSHLRCQSRSPNPRIPVFPFLFHLRTHTLEAVACIYQKINRQIYHRTPLDLDLLLY